MDLTFCRATERAAFYNILNKIPTVIESHYSAKKQIYYNLNLALTLIKKNSFKGIITIHEVLKQRFINHGIPEEKTKTNNKINFITISFFYISFNKYTALFRQDV